uniref:Uncharacterized protein n=1 Tax=viral metagenome TaxID=1070528 RepID=A0A6C0D5T9_9ZZZZ
MVPAYFIALGVLALTAVSVGLVYNKKVIEENGFQRKNILSDGLDNTTLWLYYDQSDVNSRYWNDFGARSSRVLNTPYLNLCYTSICKYNGKNYNIKIIAGLSDLAIILGGWKELPKSLQNPIAPVNEAEKNYIRARVLRQFGGLWVEPSTICLKPFPQMKKVSFFGTDKDETYSDESGTPVPNVHVMYSPEANNDIFVELEQLALKRIENREGGKQFRKDIKWDLKNIMDKYSPEIDYYPNMEFSRNQSNRRIQLEDLLSSNNIPVPKNAVYVPIDSKELEERRNFGWFLRMSEDQILESDLLISILFN